MRRERVLGAGYLIWGPQIRYIIFSYILLLYNKNLLFASPGARSFGKQNETVVELLTEHIQLPWKSTRYTFITFFDFIKDRKRNGFYYFIFSFEKHCVLSSEKQKQSESKMFSYLLPISNIKVVLHGTSYWSMLQT